MINLNVLKAIWWCYTTLRTVLCGKLTGTFRGSAPWWSRKTVWEDYGPACPSCVLCWSLQVWVGLHLAMVWAQQSTDSPEWGIAVLILLTLSTCMCSQGLACPHRWSPWGGKKLSYLCTTQSVLLSLHPWWGLQPLDLNRWVLHFNYMTLWFHEVFCIHSFCLLFPRHSFEHEHHMEMGPCQKP